MAPYQGSDESVARKRGSVQQCHELSTAETERTVILDFPLHESLAAERECTGNLVSAIEKRQGLHA
jgi:hypothetical protein